MLWAKIFLAGFIPIEPPCATWAPIYSNDPLVCSGVIDEIVVEHPEAPGFHPYWVCIPGMDSCFKPVEGSEEGCVTWAKVTYKEGTNQQVCEDAIESVALMPSGYGVWICDETGCALE